MRDAHDDYGQQLPRSCPLLRLQSSDHDLDDLVHLDDHVHVDEQHDGADLTMPSD